MGSVYLVGAGPGDPGLLTVRGLAALRSADVVIHDRLVSAALLNEASAGCVLIDVGKTPEQQDMTQDDINAMLVEHARAGRTVVRLKGGDPFVFGRGYEELQAIRAAGLTGHVIPGVTSALAGPAAVGVPATARRRARSVAVVTASTEDGTDVLDYMSLARIDTVIILMGRRRLAEISARLVAAGKPPATPACCIERATWPFQRQAQGTLEDIAARAANAGLSPPAITVIGDVVACFENPRPDLLFGRRIVLTRPADHGGVLRSTLEAAGATVVHCPLIHIDHSRTTALCAALDGIADYSWIVVTSRNAVEALRNALAAQSADARYLAPCRIAAVGPGTARALASLGLTPDLIPTEYSARGLADALISENPTGHVLYPHSSRADLALAHMLTTAGVRIDAVVAYDTQPHTWTATQRAAVTEGADAVCVYSPSAVASFITQDVPLRGALACIGPTTADAARQAGLRVDIVADPHDDAGMYCALEQFFA